MWQSSVKYLGITLLIVAGFFYFWSERIADPARLHGANKIEIRSTAGAVEIIGSDKNEVEVTVDGQSASARGVEVEIDRSHGPMRVGIARIPQSSHVEVRVPADASLSVNMSAGELRIRGVKGDIGSLLRSGKMVISVEDSTRFKSADGSVLAGAIEAPVFGRNKGGMFRRFIWAGHGGTTLRAHVTTGQLVVQ
jgi:hypothetical protein